MERIRRGTIAALLLVAASAGCSSARERATQGYLWYAGRALCSFEAAQLQTSQVVAPAVRATHPSWTTLSDVAVAADGSIWAVGLGADHVLRFPATALRAEGAVEPDLTLRSSSLRSPTNLTFDADGNLWVANRTGADPSAPDEGEIVRFDRPVTLKGDQDVQPALVLRAPGSRALYFLGAIAFDAAGQLWATSYAGIVRFAEARAWTGAVERDPDLTIANAGYLPESYYFYSVAFDARGALWAAAQTTGFNLTSVLKFADPGALSGVVSPPPEVTITGEPDVLPAGGVAFDRDGNLWLATADALLKYADPGALSGVVNPAPAVTVGVVNEASPSLNAHLVFLSSGS